MQKIFFDTNIYISFYRNGGHTELFHRLNTEGLVFLHAVVLAELFAGAHTKGFLKELHRLEKMFSSKERVIVPLKRDYVAMGKLLRKMREKGLSSERNNASFFADTLLAATARHEGMTLVTEDKDLERIKSCQNFSLLLVSESIH